MYVTGQVIIEKNYITKPTLVHLPVPSIIKSIHCSYDNIALVCEDNIIMVQGVNEHGELNCPEGEVFDWKIIDLSSVEPTATVKQFVFANISSYLLVSSTGAPLFNKHTNFAKFDPLTDVTICTTCK